MQQKRRRSKGAALGMSAIIALVLIVVGICAFFFIRLLGGAREISNATDAGILNVCKKALKEYKIPISKEFAMCAVPEGEQLNLLSYNRVVAQAIVVLMNAQQDGSKEGLSNARRVWSDVERIGKEFADAFSDDDKMAPYFEEIANANNRKMFGNAVVKEENIFNAFMRPGSSSNVYLDPEILPDPKFLPEIPLSKGQLTASNGQKYIAGYQPISFSGMTLYTVPLFPQQAPHLVSTKDFNEAMTPPMESVPPNAFKVEAHSRDTGKNQALQSLAAAVVGVVSTKENPGDFAAAVPGGYIEIANLPGRDMPNNWKTSYDALLSIFNREVYYGLEVSTSGCFSVTPGEVQAWVAYNNSAGGDPNGRNPSLYPPSLGFDDPSMPVKKTLRFGAAEGQLATLADALKIKDFSICDPTTYDYQRAGICADMFANLLTNYGREWQFGAPMDRPEFGYTNVEHAKGAVLNAFANQNLWYVDLEIEKIPPSGVKVFKRGQPFPNPDRKFDANGNLTLTFEYDVSFGRVGTIRELIEHSSTCPTQIIKKVSTRCRQICPTATQADIDKLMEKELPMGGKDLQPYTLYIYQKEGKLVIEKEKPKTWTQMKPDGKHPFDKNTTGFEPFDWRTCNICMQYCYRVDGTLVNTAAHWKELENPVTKKKQLVLVNGDGNSLVQLFLKMESPKGTTYTDGLWAYDRACWHASSGANNLLGRLEFSQFFIGKDKEQPDKMFTMTNPN